VPTNRTFIDPHIGSEGTRVSAAQSFTAGVSGQLTKVELPLTRFDPLTGGPVVELTAAVRGLPTGPVLASAVIPPAAVPASPTIAWVPVPLPGPVTVSEGQQYAIILRPPANAAPGWLVLWQADVPGTYAGGTVASAEDNGPWTLGWEPLFLPADAGFRTYVEVAPPPSCPTPTITGTHGPDVLTGTAGPDVIAGLGGSDVINGLGGDDILCGGDGFDVLNGGPGNDRLLGEDHADVLNGGDGDDTLLGGDGPDHLDGGSGTDACNGGGSPNSLQQCESGVAD